VQLKELVSLGAIDAETDFRPDFFVPSTSWDRVRRREAPIAVGRKGTGKTALRFALTKETEKSPNVLTTPLTFRDYPWAAHHLIFDETVGGRSRYQETWIFLVLVELAKLRVGVDQRPPNSDEARQVMEAVEEFLKQNWGEVAFDHRETFRKDHFAVSKKTLSPGGAGFQLGQMEWAKVDRAQLGNLLSRMNRWLKSALERIIEPDSEYFVVFDELDLDFQRGSEPYHDSMVGLVLACQHVYLWAKENGLPATPVLLMRDDIYADLAFPDKNKITTNLVEEIQWNDGTSGANALKSVIDRRIAVLLEQDVPDPWTLLFDEEVMRGTQHKYSHMVQRTYLRPRDLIYFANECIEQARRQGRIVDGTRIMNEDVTAARTPFSTYMRRELDDEIRAHYQEWQSWLEVLRRIGKMVFERDDFDQECERSPELLNGTEKGEVLEALYRFGVIGFARYGGSGRGGTQEYWSFRDGTITFDPHAPYFKVHQGLKETLDLKERKE
jgi:hypothetical protein